MIKNTQQRAQGHTLVRLAAELPSNPSRTLTSQQQLVAKTIRREASDDSASMSAALVAVNATPLPCIQQEK